MKKAIIFPVVLIIFCIIASNAFAGKARGQAGMPSDSRAENLRNIVFFGGIKAINAEKAKLTLSDKQAEKIGRSNIDYKIKSLKLIESVQLKQFELDSMLREDNINLSEIRELLVEISKLEVERGMLKILHQLDIERILTPAQKNMLKSL